MQASEVRSGPHYAPGMRVEIRDAEWRIQRIDASSDGGHVLTCEGLSELVQGRDGLFLTKLEFEHSDQPQAFEQCRRDERQRDIDRAFNDYRDWLANTQTAEDQPYIQVVAVFTGLPAGEVN